MTGTPLSFSLLSKPADKMDDSQSRKRKPVKLELVRKKKSKDELTKASVTQSLGSSLLSKQHGCLDIDF